MILGRCGDYVLRERKDVLRVFVYAPKEWLRTGQIDLAFLSSTCREEFTLTELFKEPLLCITPVSYTHLQHL